MGGLFGSYDIGTTYANTNGGSRDENRASDGYLWISQTEADAPDRPRTPIQYPTPRNPAWTPPPAVAYDSRMSAPLPVSVSAWRCRLCSYERYHRVSVTRKNGARYETAFFACSQCSVMFLNPTQFNALGHANPNVEMPPIVTPLRKSRSRSGGALLSDARTGRTSARKSQ